MLMLKAIEDNSREGTTDWYGAWYNYVARRRLAEWADGRQIRPYVLPRSERGPDWTVATRCFTYVSRSGRHAYTGCTTTGW
jgi:hypothetical protein